MSGFSRKYKPAYKSKDKIPEKYFEGLNEKERTLMTKEILQRPQSLKYWSADKAYTKRLRKEKETLPKGQYTIAFYKKYGKENGKSLQRISKVTGIRLAILKEVEKRAYGAWSSGHKPGVFPSQWARSRVYSFVMGGKTRKTADKDLWELHLKDLKKKRKKNPRDESFLKRLIITKEYDVPGYPGIWYTAYLDEEDEENLVGELYYSEGREDITDVFIKEEYRKMGVAGYLYDLIEKDYRIKLKPSRKISKEAQYFWKNRLKKNPKNQSLLNRITLPYDKKGNIYYYDIMLDDINIGTVRYDSLRNEQDIIIDEPYQKQGIGTLVYDTIEKQFGVKLKPSNSLSYGGIEFWKKRKVD